MRPTVRAPGRSPSRSSSAESTTRVGRSAPASAARRCVLALAGEPTTTIASAAAASSASSPCRLRVAAQMVFSMRASGQRRRTAAAVSAKRASDCVLCEMSATGAPGSGRASTSAGPETTVPRPSEKPSRPTTSACPASPSRRTARPSRAASRHVRWMRPTWGQVASSTRRPSESSHARRAGGMPWARTISTEPGASPAGSGHAETPSASRRATSCRLWMSGPSVRMGAPPPSRAARSAASMARRTPQQNPADLARTTFMGRPQRALRRISCAKTVGSSVSRNQ